MKKCYPDLFPGDGARLRRVVEPLWGGQWCTDAVTPIMKKTYMTRLPPDRPDRADLIPVRPRRANSLCPVPPLRTPCRVFGGVRYFNQRGHRRRISRPAEGPAILDIDYHHGNGTEFFEERKYIFTGSIHGDPDFDIHFWGMPPRRAGAGAKART